MTASSAAERNLRRERIAVTAALLACHHASWAVLLDDQGLITLPLLVVPASMGMWTGQSTRKTETSMMSRLKRWMCPNRSQACSSVFHDRLIFWSLALKDLLYGWRVLENLAQRFQVLFNVQSLFQISDFVTAFLTFFYIMISKVFFWFGIMQRKKGENLNCSGIWETKHDIVPITYI